MDLCSNDIKYSLEYIEHRVLFETFRFNKEFIKDYCGKILLTSSFKMTILLKTAVINRIASK